MIKRGWQLIFLLIILGVMFQMFVETVRPLMIYIVGGVFALAVLFLLFLVGRYFFYRSRML
jgi:hypothetical protein